jgi:hypothetical protein
MKSAYAPLHHMLRTMAGSPVDDGFGKPGDVVGHGPPRVIVLKARRPVCDGGDASSAPTTTSVDNTNPCVTARPIV